MNITRALYKAARISADLTAVRKGPAAIGRRAVRKVVYRKTNGMIGAMLRSIMKG